MKTDNKLKRVEAILTKKGYNSNTIADAIAETNRFFKLEQVSISYFVEALESTYCINGVER